MARKKIESLTEIKEAVATTAAAAEPKETKKKSSRDKKGRTYATGKRKDAVDEIKKSNHISEIIKEMEFNITDFNLLYKDDLKISSKDWHYRYHNFTMKCDGKIIFENCVIDFKHYFCVPISYLLKNRNNRHYKLEDVYSEQITLKFSNFLSRVPMPD